jgi:uncharacterized phage protein (TIGR02220 family)
MSIIRAFKKNNYSVVSNTPLRDSALSWGAMGLLTHLLSKPDNWKVYLSQLCNWNAVDGEHMTKKYMKELMAKGYIERAKIRQKGGVFGWEYVVHENPATTQSTIHGATTGGVTTGGATTDGESPTTNTDIVSTDTLSTEVEEEYVGQDPTPPSSVSNEGSKVESMKPQRKPKRTPEEEQLAKEVIDYLNDKAGRCFEYSETNIGHIVKIARMKIDGKDVTKKQFVGVVDYKVSEWRDDAKMKNYLKPYTLFGSKFPQYLEEAREDARKKMMKPDTNTASPQTPKISNKDLFGKL